MTRINVGIPPKELSGRHLIAEHREIKRVPNLVKRYVNEVDGISNLDLNIFVKIPNKFTLGKGHVTFFYNKLGYLLNRYREIYQECLNRGYKVQNYESAWAFVPLILMNNYDPTQEDINLIKQRILEKTHGA